MEYSRRFYKRTLLGDGHDGILAPPVPPIPSEISRHAFLVVVLHVVAAQCQILDSDRSAGPRSDWIDHMGINLPK